jgi:hypothetical protein
VTAASISAARKRYETDARAIVVGLWLLDENVFATTFYIGNVKWD